MAQEKDLNASTHDRILSPAQKERFYVSFSIYIHIHTIQLHFSLQIRDNFHTFNPL